VALTDATGAVVERYDYGDFGQPQFFNGAGGAIASTGFGNPYLFTGREYDPETCLYNYRTRYLDSATGRFVERDQIGPWGDQESLGNALTYASNNPWTKVDPFGTQGGRVWPWEGWNPKEVWRQLLEDPNDPFSENTFYRDIWRKLRREGWRIEGTEFPFADFEQEAMRVSVEVEDERIVEHYLGHDWLWENNRYLLDFDKKRILIDAVQADTVAEMLRGILVQLDKKDPIQVTFEDQLTRGQVRGVSNDRSPLVTLAHRNEAFGKTFTASEFRAFTQLATMKADLLKDVARMGFPSSSVDLMDLRDQETLAHKVYDLWKIGRKALKIIKPLDISEKARTVYKLENAIHDRDK